MRSCITSRKFSYFDASLRLLRACGYVSSLSMHLSQGHGPTASSGPLAEVTSSSSLLIAGAPEGVVYLIVRSESRDEVLVVPDGAEITFGRTGRADVRLN